MFLLPTLRHRHGASAPLSSTIVVAIETTMWDTFVAPDCEVQVGNLQGSRVTKKTKRRVLGPVEDGQAAGNGCCQAELEVQETPTYSDCRLLESRSLASWQPGNVTVPRA